MRKLPTVLAGLAVLTLLGVGIVGWRQTSQPDYRVARAREALRRGDRQTARTIAARLAQAGYPDHAHLLRGELLLSQASARAEAEALSGDELLSCQKALEEFNQIKDQGALRRQAAALSGQCLLFLKNLPEAERVFQFVLSEQPDHADAHRGLGAVYYDLGALNRAAHHLEAVARLDPEDGRPHRLLGLIHKDLDHPKEAVAHYREALNRRLSEARAREVRVELAEVLIRLSEYAEALEQIEGRKPRPEDVGKAVALRAECFWGLGRTGEARALLDEALKLDLRSPEVVRLRARFYLEAGDAAEARRLLQERVAADRHDHTSRTQLALALEALGQKEEAAEQRALAEQTRKLLTEMTRLTQEAMERPQDAEPRRRLAEVCDKLERWELAAMWRSAADAVQAGGSR